VEEGHDVLNSSRVNLHVVHDFTQLIEKKQNKGPKHYQKKTISLTYRAVLSTTWTQS
jgi:hypothetical protein